MTTNLSISEIETQYGNLVRNRLWDMINLIGFEKVIRDKKK